jgi:hypothetical protein
VIVELARIEKTLNIVGNSVRKRIRVMILAYIELSDGEYKFHICDISDNLNYFIKLEDHKMNIVVIKINWRTLKKR